MIETTAKCFLLVFCCLLIAGCERARNVQQDIPIPQNLDIDVRTRVADDVIQDVVNGGLAQEIKRHFDGLSDEQIADLNIIRATSIIDEGSTTPRVIIRIEFSYPIDQGAFSYHLDEKKSLEIVNFVSTIINNVLQEKLTNFGSHVAPHDTEQLNPTSSIGLRLTHGSAFANDTHKRLKAMEIERDGIFTHKGSTETFFLENCSKQLAFWQQAAEQGQATAQSLLAGCYLWGQGTAKDQAQALVWYRKAAEQGDAFAQYTLGVMSINGEGIAKDERQAEIWFRKAAEQGYAYAQNNLGQMYFSGKDITQALVWIRKAAEQGLAGAQHNLGVAYVEGKAIPKDENQGVEWFRKAAEQGYAPSQYNLGVAYEYGAGTAKNDSQAVLWYHKAAEQGIAPAKEALMRLSK